jgi:hypothetical protein
VAMWRESVLEQPPAELLEFRLVDWIGRCEPNADYYPWFGWPAFKTPRETWHHARFEWLRQHPGRHIDGMDAVDIIFADGV